MIDMTPYFRLTMAVLAASSGVGYMFLYGIDPFEWAEVWFKP